jgi:superfamily II DNA or RNA helicase
MLREYQVDIINRVRNSFNNNKKRVCVVLPTGTGKTVVFAQIAKMTAHNKKHVLILTHRREIHRQTMQKLHSIGVNAGQITSNSIMSYNEYIQCGMIGTVVNRLNKINKPDLIIIDETHHILGNTWQAIANYYSDVPRIGFTATPERLDGRGLGENNLFNEIIIGMQIKEAVKQGFLSYPIIYKPPGIPQSFKIKKGDYDTKEQETILSEKHIVGDVIQHYKDHLDGLPVVCFCPTVEHSKLMADQFSSQGYKSYAVYGNMDDKLRDKYILGLSNGDTQILTSCDVISEGVDVPMLAGAILLRKTLSLSLYLQQIGRALRPYPGKDKTIILDHAGNSLIHGHVLQDREWSLYSKKRDAKKNKPSITECPKCYSVWEGKPSKCLNCNFDFTKIVIDKKKIDIKVIEGKLQADYPDLDFDLFQVALKALASDTKELKKKLLWSTAYKLANKENGKSELDKLREILGYKIGWTEIVWEKVRNGK